MRQTLPAICYLRFTMQGGLPAAMQAPSCYVSCTCWRRYSVGAKAVGKTPFGPGESSLLFVLGWRLALKTFQIPTNPFDNLGQALLSIWAAVGPLCGPEGCLHHRG